MSDFVRPHPLNLLFADLVHEAVSKEAPAHSTEQIETYLTGLLVEFLRTDRVFAIRDDSGRRLSSVFEMLAEGDVRLNAPSFEREREVHKHIGDYILFWSGVNPGFLSLLKLEDGRHLKCDYTQQGRTSYHVVSTFDHQPFAHEASLFRRLSDGFEDLAAALSRVRAELPPFAA